MQNKAQKKTSQKAPPKPTDSEWKVLSILWNTPAQNLGQIVEVLRPETGWSKTTTHTYLTRMMAKGFVVASDATPKAYSAAITRAEAETHERNGLMQRVYQGSASKLIAAFVQDGTLSAKERADLRKLLDEMEV